jgi:hypothetical protein
MEGLSLLAEARAAGLTLWVDGDRLIIRGPRSQEALVKRLLSRKAEIIRALEAQRSTSGPAGSLADADADEAEGRYWYPPPGTPLYFADESGRPSERSVAYMWTFEGSRTWYFAKGYPPP